MNCTEEMESPKNTIVFMSLIAAIVPTIFNIVAIGTASYIIYLIFALKKLSQSAALTSHWFLRTAVKTGLGAGFKEKLNDYADTRDDMKNLIQPASHY